MALIRPGAPSVVIVTGVWRPRLTRSRRTSRQRSSRSLCAVERLRNTFRPSTQMPQTHHTPVLLPQRRQGSYTVSMHTYAMS